MEGTVFNADHSVADGASVHLERESTAYATEIQADGAGRFTFSAIQAGDYVITAKKDGLRSRGVSITVLPQAASQHVDLVLGASASPQAASGGRSAVSPPAMDFADKPNFTVAGVTDWTAVGGHGSDSSLRTSEALARETLALKSAGGEHTKHGADQNNKSEQELRAALANSPGSFEANRKLGEFYLRAGRYGDALPLLKAAHEALSSDRAIEYDLARCYEELGDLTQARAQVEKLLAQADSSDLHRLSAEIDEKLGDSLAAVHEDEMAVRLDPSEQNYFDWGTELLFHRAVWQAAEVFENGANAYPKSVRMLAALGAALFAGARYDEAALRLCDASDLSPADPEPYIFMGKIQMAAPEQLPCIEQRLARFARDQPQNSMANYLYAMAIWKRPQQLADAEARQKIETLLTRAVAIDPKCGDAYLQLGILYSSQHDLKRAIAFYAKATEADPQLAEAHYRLGVAYDRTGEPEKARLEFEQHSAIEKLQAAAIERQRKEVKQFLVVLQNQTNHAPAN